VPQKRLFFSSTLSILSLSLVKKNGPTNNSKVLSPSLAVAPDCAFIRQVAIVNVVIRKCIESRNSTTQYNFGGIRYRREDKLLSRQTTDREDKYIFYSMQAIAGQKQETINIVVISRKAAN
jgi:hypothetical protein